MPAEHRDRLKELALPSKAPQHALLAARPHSALPGISYLLICWIQCLKTGTPQQIAESQFQDGALVNAMVGGHINGGREPNSRAVVLPLR